MKGRFTKAAFSDSQLTLPSQDIYKEEHSKPKTNTIIPDPIRFTTDWPPNKLVCKRFAVKDPYLDSQPIFSLPPSRQQTAAFAEAFLSSLPAFSGVTPSPAPPVPEVKEEELEPEKPEMSIFKAIFENTDSEEEDE